MLLPFMQTKESLTRSSSSRTDKPFWARIRINERPISIAHCPILQLTLFHACTSYLAIVFSFHSRVAARILGLAASSHSLILSHSFLSNHLNYNRPPQRFKSFPTFNQHIILPQNNISPLAVSHVTTSRRGGRLARSQTSV